MTAPLWGEGGDGILHLLLEKKGVEGVERGEAKAALGIIQNQADYLGIGKYLGLAFCHGRPAKALHAVIGAAVAKIEEIIGIVGSASLIHITPIREVSMLFAMLSAAVWSFSY